MTDSAPLLKADNLVIGYPLRGKKAVHVAGPMDLSLAQGGLICLVGTNGSGKSTLMRTLAGLQPAIGGTICYQGISLSSLKPEQVATAVSVVLTDAIRPANLSVASLISLGRYPYTDWLGRLSQVDKEKISWAVELVGVRDLLDYKVEELSDGQYQLVMLARALTQDTPVVLLDEPTAHLDIQHRINLLRLLAELAGLGKAILFSTHELELAIQAADSIWIIAPEGPLFTGAPEDLVLDGRFQKVFDPSGELFDISTGTFPIRHARGENVGFEASGDQGFWTRRALARCGYQVVALGPDLRFEVQLNEYPRSWTLMFAGNREDHFSLGSLTTRMKRIVQLSL